MLSEDTSRQLSGLIVNVTNPAVLICSAFDDGPKASLQELGLALGIFLLSYGVLILFSYLIPLLLRVPQADHYSYRMLTIFGNVGFIGIPLASAVLGSESLIYVSINGLVFNVIVYTYGLAVLKKAARQQHPDDTALLPDKESLWHKLINAGTVSAVLTIVFYLGNFPVPTIISSTLSYTGRATTLLSMLVLGADDTKGHFLPSEALRIHRNPADIGAGRFRAAGRAFRKSSAYLKYHCADDGYACCQYAANAL
jgi:hypothetical protein